MKSKSETFCARMMDTTNIELLIVNQTESIRDHNKQNENCRIMNGLQYISELNESDSFLAYKEEHSELFHQAEG